MISENFLCLLSKVNPTKGTVIHPEWYVNIYFWYGYKLVGCNVDSFHLSLLLIT